MVADVQHFAAQWHEYWNVECMEREVVSEALAGHSIWQGIAVDFCQVDERVRFGCRCFKAYRLRRIGF